MDFYTFSQTTAAFALALAAPVTSAQEVVEAGPPPVTYADMVQLSDSSAIVVKTQIREAIPLEPERSPGLMPGKVRLYIEAETISLLLGRGAIGESLRYLADVPLDENGKPPKLKKQQFIVFANPVAGRPGELQLVAPDAQLPATAGVEDLLSPILAELVSAERPPVITGVRDTLSIAGNLAGESETQIFLETKDSRPVSISVVRRPGMEPQWGVSWTEIVDQSARPPEQETLAWYRLACALPERLPPQANLSSDADNRLRASDDYRFVIRSLGPCERKR